MVLRGRKLESRPIPELKDVSGGVELCELCYSRYLKGLGFMEDSDSKYKFMYYKLKIRKIRETVTSCDDKMNIDAMLKENRERTFRLNLFS